MRNNKGSITIITLVTVLFMLAFLVSTYTIIANRRQAHEEIKQETKAIYEKDLNNLDEIYESYLADEDEEIPIYTAEQLLQIGTGNNVLINGKIYKMSDDTDFKLMDDIEFKVNDYVDKYPTSFETIDGITKWVTVEAKVYDETFDYNGYTITETDSAGNIIVFYLDRSSFLSGIELNFLIKNGTYAPEGEAEEYYDVDGNRMVDKTVKKIVFGDIDDYKYEVSGITAEAIDIDRKGSINLYRVLNSDSTTYTIYILSEDGKFVLSKNAAWTFDKLYALESIENLHLLDTSRVTNMRDMFCDCASLTNVDLSNFDTRKVTNMTGMFARMFSIEYLDLLSFDTSNVEIFNQMFSMTGDYETVLKRIYVSDKWVISDKMETDTNMFAGCTELVGGNGTVYASTAVNSARAVIDGTSAGYLTGIYNFAEGKYVNGIIKDKTEEEIAAWTTSARFTDTSITSITFGQTKDYFKIVEGYTGRAIDEQKSGAIQSYRVPNGDGTYAVYILSNSGKLIANSDASWMFDKLYMLTKFNNLNLLDTSKTTKMKDMFCDCASIVSLDLSNFNTAKVTTTEGMFARMYTIEILDLSNFNTSNVTTMLNMFVLSISATETPESFQSVTPALKTIYVSDKWTTSKTTNETIFANCTNLVGGNGTVFNTSNTTTTYARVDTASTPGYFTLINE